MIYNFQARFAEAVEQGRKLQTIRAARKDGKVAKIGEVLHLYTGLRSKGARKLREARCGMRLIQSKPSPRSPSSTSTGGGSHETQEEGRALRRQVRMRRRCSRYVEFRQTLDVVREMHASCRREGSVRRPHASAEVKVKPRLTPFKAWLLWDAEGTYVPSLHTRRRYAREDKAAYGYRDARWRITRVIVRRAKP